MAGTAVLKASKRAVVVVSGGLDSTVLLYSVIDKGFEPFVLSFDYGQRHLKELDFAAKTCAFLELEHDIVDLTSAQGLLRSTLTFQGEVPEGHYSAATMKQTIVPNRNAIMLSLAYGWAVSLAAEAVFIGAHAGDHAIYPDCRLEFFQQLAAAFNLGNAWSQPIRIEAPFVNLSKAAVVLLGEELGVAFDKTWSCYQGFELHCGRCGTCVERAEAFHVAGVTDPTVYSDKEYWKTAVKHA